MRQLSALARRVEKFDNQRGKEDRQAEEELIWASEVGHSDCRYLRGHDLLKDFLLENMVGRRVDWKGRR